MSVCITPDPIPPLENNDAKTTLGSELIFHGRVRDQENGKSINGIFYEHYPEMAEKELKKLATAAKQKFDISDLDCIHRVGFVENGHMSLRVVVWSKHRQEGFEAMNWFISELKVYVPIWKNAVYT